MGEREDRTFKSGEDVGAFLDSPAFAEGFKEDLLEKLCEMPDEVLVAVLRGFATALRGLDLLTADARAPEFARRYREERVRISYGEAVELARGLMRMRTPYQRRPGEKRPADELPYIYDYEILAAKAAKDGCFSRGWLSVRRGRSWPGTRSGSASRASCRTRIRLRASCLSGRWRWLLARARARIGAGTKQPR